MLITLSIYICLPFGNIECSLSSLSLVGAGTMWQTFIRKRVTKNHKHVILAHHNRISGSSCSLYQCEVSFAIRRTSNNSLSGSFQVYLVLLFVQSQFRGCCRKSSHDFCQLWKLLCDHIYCKILAFNKCILDICEIPYTWRRLQLSLSILI